MYYFENVRKVQYIFAGNSVTNVTYSVRTFFYQSSFLHPDHHGRGVVVTCALSPLNLTPLSSLT